jgi:Tat protein secretion system quality control protein TatD with DNase activity
MQSARPTPYPASSWSIPIAILISCLAKIAQCFGKHASNQVNTLLVWVNLEDFPKSWRSGKRGNLFATVGVHPEYTDALSPEEQLVDGHHPKVIGIGETGLITIGKKQNGVSAFPHHISGALCQTTHNSQRES